MPDTDGEREWLDSAERETSAQGLPRPELNPLFNPLLSENMGRWAQVYYTSAPEQREQAVEKLLQDLQAESGGKSPAISQTPINAASPSSISSIRTDRTAAVSLPRKVESDLQEFNEEIPQFKKFRPEPAESAERDALVCPACQHKNAAEQRFCGICGFSLAQEPPADQARQHIAPEPIVPRPQSPESDWQWLRQRSLANFQAVHDTNDGSRFIFGMIVLVLLVAGGFFAWQNRSRLLPAQPPTTTPAGSVTSANVSNTPSSVPAAPQGAVRTSPTAEHSQSTVIPPAPAPTAPSASASGSLSQTAGDGRDELDQGRRYLEGQGVPRNSWMASQWLWKSVAKKNNDAVLLLSDLYLRGDGVARSCEQARVLLVAAAKKGSPAAAQKLRTVETTCR